MEACIQIQDLLLDLCCLDEKFERIDTLDDLSDKPVSFKVNFATRLSEAVKSLGFPGDIAYSQILYGEDKSFTESVVRFLERCIQDSHVGSVGTDSHQKSNGWSDVRVALETWIDGSRPTQRRKRFPWVEANEIHEHLEATETIDQELIDQWKATESAYQSSSARLGRIESVLRSREEENIRLEAKVKARERARLLSSADAEGNFAKLQVIVKGSRERLLDLVREWEMHRVPLVNQLKDKCETKSKLASTQFRMREEISKMREELQQIHSRLHIAHDSTTSIIDDEDTLSKDTKSKARSQVIARVLDSVKQVKKQGLEIERIVEEVRILQRELSTVLESLLQVEGETDELVFAMAKNHPIGRETYEFFVDMTESFDELMKLEHEAHLAQLEALEKHSRCHSIAARVSLLKVESVLGDLEKIREENLALRDIWNQ